jgi:hypothetical protein
MESVMNENQRDALRALKHSLREQAQKDRRAAKRSRAEARRAIERDDWKAFKTECVRLKA